MEIAKKSGFNEEAFERLLYNLGAYDHLAKEEKGSGAGRRKGLDAVESENKVAQVTLSPSIGPAPRHPIVVVGMFGIGIFGAGCGVLPDCKRNLAGITREGGRLVENGGKALGKKAEELLRAIGEQISKMAGEKDKEKGDDSTPSGPDSVDGSDSTSPESSDPEEIAEPFEDKIDNIVEHLTEEDLEAARDELAGEVVVTKPDGKPFDHVNEVENAQKGLETVIDKIKARLGHANKDGKSSLTPGQREALERQLGRASNLLDHSRGFVPKKP
jgi:hypothetical protein